MTAALCCGNDDDGYYLWLLLMMIIIIIVSTDKNLLFEYWQLNIYYNGNTPLHVAII